MLSKVQQIENPVWILILFFHQNTPLPWMNQMEAFAEDSKSLCLMLSAADIGFCMNSQAQTYLTVSAMEQSLLKESGILAHFLLNYNSYHKTITC